MLLLAPTTVPRPYVATRTLLLLLAVSLLLASGIALVQTAYGVIIVLSVSSLSTARLAAAVAAAVL
jgi:hypothetical protein